MSTAAKPPIVIRSVTPAVRRLYDVVLRMRAKREQLAKQERSA